MKRIPLSLLSLLALLSGCCALAYEVLYMRVLTTLLGDMLYVHAALLSTFLVGIGVGARLAPYFMRWLWLFEILSGLYAVALPVAANWSAGREFMTRVSAEPPLTILVTMGFLVLPSILIGFTIPLFSAYIKWRSHERNAFQGVYIVYNIGALVSILIVEFWLVRQLGVSQSLLLIGMINVFNGVALLTLRFPQRQWRKQRQPRHFPARIVLALALVSVASAAFQMFFLRLTYLVFGPHRENFVISLSIALIGVFVGAWLIVRTRLSFATLLTLIPVSIAVIFALHRPIVALHDRLSPLFRSSHFTVAGEQFLIGFVYALVPLILFGATIPALMRSEREVAGESGYLLWISSVANAVGYLGYVLLGHPRLSGSMQLVAICSLALAAALLAANWRWSRLQQFLSVAAVVVLIVLCVRWDDRYLYLARWVDDVAPEDEVLVFKSGPESATLLRTPEFEWVSYNGHSSVVIRRDDRLQPPELLSGVIPALNAPRLGNALVLGLGTGATGGAAARIFEQTDVVEINEAFIRMLPEVAHINLDIQDNPAASIHLTDGRSFLIGREGEYDVIVNSIPAPTYYSASKIYTLEFYRRVRAALAPDGVFSTWLAIHELSEPGIETVLSALYRTFPVCDLHMIVGGYYMASCSDRPLVRREFEDLGAQPILVDALQEALPGLDVGDVLRDLRLSDNIFADYEPRVPRDNTDDRPVLEFLVVQRHEVDRLGLDPFLNRSEQYNVDPVRIEELKEAGSLRRRAMTYRRLNSAFYEKMFVPLMESQTE